MIRKLKLVFLCAILIVMDVPVCWSESSYPEIFRPFIERERNDLAASLNGDVSRIFFIYIFNRLVPIPNRYVLKVNESGRHVFESMTGETIGRALLIGTIEAGTIANDNETGFYRKKTEYGLLYDNYKGMGIDVYIYKPSKKTNPIKRILISNGHEYLIIADQNSELWEDMFKAARVYP